MTDKRTVSLTVNGRRREATVETRLTLVDLLRHELGLTGTHVGCEHGVCGACTVLVDGLSVRSCLMLAVQASGHAVTTVEGLAGAGNALNPLQDAFWEKNALQCGFLPRHAADIDRIARRQRLAHGGGGARHDLGQFVPLHRIPGDRRGDAAGGGTNARRAPSPRQGARLMASTWFGASVRRKEDPALLSGRGNFVDDIHLPHMLHATMVRSPHAHARVVGIDTSAALKVEGVHLVLTHADLPEAMRVRARSR